MRYSAHNQRGVVTVKTYINKDQNIVDDYKNKILDAMEANASSILYPILKRPDEKRVTERAYENPRFVEDLIRLIAADLVEFDWLRHWISNVVMKSLSINMMLSLN